MVTWGPWEYSGGNGMRVGIEATGDPGGISHGETAANYTIEFWTENQYTYGDGQTMNFGTVFGTSSGFTNNQGGEQVKRFTKTYAYKYGANSYGSSPGSISFSCSVTGAYNGVTPYHSRSYTIPARPYALPAAPSGVVASRVSDETNKVTWNNRPTAGEPYTGVDVWRYIYSYGSYAGSGGNWVKLINGGATMEAYSDTGMVPNRKSRYYVESQNTIGYSSNTVSNDIWTMPATPTSVVRSGTTGNQTITWQNNVGYGEYVTEVWHAANGVWDSAPLANVGAGGPGTTGTYTHVSPSPTVKHKYKVRTNPTASGVPASSFSGETTESAGTTNPPLAPINLQPPTGTIASPDDLFVVSWTHRPGADAAKQSAYQVQYRVNGGSYTATGKITSTSNSYTIPGPYNHNDVYDWQVQTWGLNASAGPYTALVQVTMAPAVPAKYPLLLDLSTGRIEASSTTVIGGGGSSLVVQDENVTKVSGSTILDFRGAGVSAALGETGEAVITIPGTGQIGLDPVRVATVTGVNITLSGTQTIDGVALVVGDRVLLRYQTTATENGIWLVQVGAWTRAQDADTVAEVQRGVSVTVLEGSQCKFKTFTQLSPITTYGSDAQFWRILTFVDQVGAFSFPSPQGLGHTVYNVNTKAMVVWDGYGWSDANNWSTCTSTTRPIFIGTGYQIYETDTKLSYVYTGATDGWQPLGGGGAGSQSAVFNQGTPATTWTVTHALPFQPNISVVDSAGTLVEGDVQYTSATQIVLKFSAAFSGTAYLS